MRRTIIVISVLGALVAAGPASATTSSAATYGGKGQVIHEVVKGANTVSPSATQNASTSPAESAASGSLPFTGFDIALLVAGGVLLVSVGVAMRRMAARPRRLSA